MKNSSYTEIIKGRPFGWTFDGHPIVDSFEFEQIDPIYWHNFLVTSNYLVVYAGVIYLVTIFGLKRFMKNRPPYELKIPLFLWNLSLGIFSIIGFSRILPGLLHTLTQPGGFYQSICEKKGINVPTMYWGLLFAISKFFELGDTLFIVLRKRPLVLLQWYHHLATMTTAWLVAPMLEPIIRWYGFFNYGVHSLMYPYFALKTINVAVPGAVAKLITTLQLAQMIFGFAINMTTLYMIESGHDCVRYPLSIQIFNVIYGSFILLFGKLFFDSVMKNYAGKKEKQD